MGLIQSYSSTKLLDCPPRQDSLSCGTTVGTPSWHKLNVDSDIQLNAPNPNGEAFYLINLCILARTYYSMQTQQKPSNCLVNEWMNETPEES